MQRLRSSSRGGGGGEQAAAPSCDIIAGLDEVTPAANGQPMKAAAAVYRAKLAGHARVVTLSWSRHAFSVSVSGADGSAASCTVELRRSPWQLWNLLPRRRQSSGARRLDLGDGASATPLRVLWDLRRARWHHDSSHGEPRGGSYYVALEAEEPGTGTGGEVVFLVSGGCDSSKIPLPPVARREHVFGRGGRFAAKAIRFGGGEHEIAIEIDGHGPEMEEMRIGIDGEEAAVVVKRLRWKFRGNQSVTFGKAKVEVYWDVHDWLFTQAIRPALFIFRPIVLSSSGDANANANAGFCLYLYAWKLD